MGASAPKDELAHSDKAMAGRNNIEVLFIEDIKGMRGVRYCFFGQRSQAAIHLRRGKPGKIINEPAAPASRSTPRPVAVTLRAIHEAVFGHDAGGINRAVAGPGSREPGIRRLSQEGNPAR